jgi:transposase
MDNDDEPEVLAVVRLPSAVERRLREVMLARVMLVRLTSCLRAIRLGLEAARDLNRELRHAYPESLCRLRPIPARRNLRQSAS